MGRRRIYRDCCDHCGEKIRQSKKLLKKEIKEYGNGGIVCKSCGYITVVGDEPLKIFRMVPPRVENEVCSGPMGG